MQWLDAVNARAKRKNKVLFMPDDAIFDALAPLTERCPACRRCCRGRRAPWKVCASPACGRAGK